jgi:2-iminoacetate synthase
VIDELLDGNYMPSFCTACYRKGRTGEHFMEFSVPGFIKRFCSPNAMLTLAEYLSDYASDDTKTKGWEAIEKNIVELEKHQPVSELRNRLNKIKEGQRDIYF